MERNDREQAQKDKIEAEKSALAGQLVFYVILSIVVSGCFYGLAILQNPNSKPDEMWRGSVECRLIGTQILRKLSSEPHATVTNDKQMT